MASTATTAVQIVSVASALMASGGMVTLSLHDIPQLRPQPASRSLPAVRWLFSRGSHTFPNAAIASGLGFLYGAYAYLPPAAGRGLQKVISLSQFGANGLKTNGLILAAALAWSIAPWTRLVMLPTNLELMEMNQSLGGYRSQSAADEDKSGRIYRRTGKDSIAGKSEGSEFTDRSGPQEVTKRQSSAQEDERAKELMDKFTRLNLVRAALLGAGGIIALSSILL